MVWLTFNPTPVNAGKNPQLIQSSQTVSRLHQKSRNSAVKIIGINGGHGSGTYVQIGNQFGVLTARHVAEMDSIFIIESEHDSSVGTAVYLSSHHDIAFIQTSRLHGMRAISIENLKPFNHKIGETVIYSGFPSSYSTLTSTGIISGFEESYNAVICQGFAWPGSSGSGVFTSNGNLVGIVYAVGVETYVVPEIIETLVYVAPLSEDEILNIRRSLERQGE
jgi:S1-C subfamily serine protease